MTLTSKLRYRKVAGQAMDFGALPPEVNSGRMYLGPGPASLRDASAGWERLAVELHSTASAYQSVISGLTDESWLGGASTSMASAFASFLAWLRATAGQCEEAATRATAVAAAYETAYAMTVPPPVVVANRDRLATLIGNNSLGQHTPAIAATEAEYCEMWAKDAAAMYNYAARSAAASSFSIFTQPLAGRAVAQGGSGAGTQTTPTKLISSVPPALRGLSTPGVGSDPFGTGLDLTGGDSMLAPEVPVDGLGALADPWEGMDSGMPSGIDSGAEADFGQAEAVGYLSVPPSWADSLAMAPPDPGDLMTWRSTRVAIKPAPGGVAQPAMGGMVGCEVDGGVERIGYRGTPLICSSVTG